MAFLKALKEQPNKTTDWRTKHLSIKFCDSALDPSDPVNKQLADVIINISNLQKLYAVCDALFQLKSQHQEYPKLTADTIKQALENPESNLYKALNIKRHFSFTVHGPAGFFKPAALSLQKAQAIFNQPTTRGMSADLLRPSDCKVCG